MQACIAWFQATVWCSNSWVHTAQRVGLLFPCFWKIVQTGIHTQTNTRNILYDFQHHNTLKQRERERKSITGFSLSVHYYVSVVCCLVCCTPKITWKEPKPVKNYTWAVQFLHSWNLQNCHNTMEIEYGIESIAVSFFSYFSIVVFCFSLNFLRHWFSTGMQEATKIKWCNETWTMWVQCSLSINNYLYGCYSER